MSSWQKGKPREARRPVIDRLLERVHEDANGCWIYEGSKAHGYGDIKGPGREGRHLKTHRVTYEYFIAEIPAGLQLDHLCRTRSCCNPWHLEPVTPLVNALRGEGMAAVTHCHKGHPYDEANTYREPKTGHRSCRICLREANRRAWARLKHQRVSCLACRAEMNARSLPRHITRRHLGVAA